MTASAQKTVRALILVFILSASVSPAAAQDAVVPGRFVIEPPTLNCLGFEWRILRGDDNRNATVAVTYRKRGEPSWREALPLLRVGGERISDFLDYETPHLFAGSILGLEPGSAYECRFVLEDPDGVLGDGGKTVTVTTREEPRVPEGGRVFHVYPPGYEGTRGEPASTGVKRAYFGPGGDDWGLAAKPRVEPGDIILVHAGLYKTDRMSYSNPLGLTFHGTYVFTKDGEPDRPIVVKAAGDGEVIFDGDGAYRLFDVMAADHMYFEGFTVRNTDIAFYAGVKGVGGCSGLVVRNCRFEDVGVGVFTEYEGSRNFYIADNVMIGREDPTRLTGWNRRVWGKYGKLSDVSSFVGVKVYGAGHVICHNTIKYFHDGVDINMHGDPEVPRDKKCVAVDIHNNDIFLATDDGIESDGGEFNIRVWENRCVNIAHHGLSAQPVYGGPVYFIRNIVHHVFQGGALKFNNHPAGLLVYHNTFITEWQSGGQPFSNADVRNNLFLGADHPDRPILRVRTFTSYTAFDHNGYRPNRTAGDGNFLWLMPAEDVLRDFSGEFQRTPHEVCADLDAFRNGSGQEEHGVEVDYDIFERVIKPDPADPTRLYDPSDMDFSLKAGSAAVDAGCVLPTVNDGFTGAAPDLGALERGREKTVYGPRK